MKGLKISSTNLISGKMLKSNVDVGKTILALLFPFIVKKRSKF